MTKLKTLETEPQTEAELRKQMKLYLEEHGFRVKATSDNRKTRKQLDKIPDFLITHDDFKKGWWCHVEVKFGPDWQWSDPKQEEAYHCGDFLCWWWLEDCKNWVEYMEKNASKFTA